MQAKIAWIELESALVVVNGRLEAASTGRKLSQGFVDQRVLGKPLLRFANRDVGGFGLAVLAEQPGESDVRTDELRARLIELYGLLVRGAGGCAIATMFGDLAGPVLKRRGVGVRLLQLCQQSPGAIEFFQTNSAANEPKPCRQRAGSSLQGGVVARLRFAETASFEERIRQAALRGRVARFETECRV